MIYALPLYPAPARGFFQDSAHASTIFPVPNLIAQLLFKNDYWIEFDVLSCFLFLIGI